MGHGKARSFLTMIEGCHDFGAFCRKADRPSNTRRTIIEAGMETAVCSKGDDNRKVFLTNMVRIYWYNGSNSNGS